VENVIKVGQLGEILLAPQTVLNQAMVQVELPAAILVAQGRSLTLKTIATSFPIHDKACLPVNQHCLVMYSGQSSTDCPKPIALCSITEEKLIKPQVVLTSPPRFNA